MEEVKNMEIEIRHKDGRVSEHVVYRPVSSDWLGAFVAAAVVALSDK